MVHGQIDHGTQFVDQELRHVPTTYYAWDSGIGVALNQLHRQRRQGLRIGVIGLGTGTISALARSGDSVRYYEINPNVECLARKYFTYLSDTAADVDVVLGYARVVLEHEAEQGRQQQFDILVLNAFDGDAIPLHLLTREAYEIYWSHLRPDGLLAVHVSNIHVVFEPVVRGLSQQNGHRAVRILSTEQDKWSVGSARWVIVTNNQAFLAAKDVQVA